VWKKASARGVSAPSSKNSSACSTATKDRVWMMRSVLSFPVGGRCVR